jgi:hypothetical protein
MENLDMNPQLPADEDPLLDSYLSKLEQFSPRSGFEDRIMAQVRVPAPRWIRQLQAYLRSLADTGRVWWLVGGMATMSFASLTAMVALIATRTVDVRTVWGGALTGVLLSSWRALLGLATDIARSTYALFEMLAVREHTLVAVAGVAAVGTMLCAWALHRTMQPAGVTRAEVDAIR